MMMLQFREELALTSILNEGDDALLEAKLRHPALSPYLSLPAVLAQFTDGPSADYPLRERLTRVFIEEAQRGQAPVWMGALFIAYQPMLLNLRKRLVAEYEFDELDLVVCDAFAQAVRDLPLAQVPDRLALRLRQRTARAIFRLLRTDRTEAEQLASLLRDLAPDSESLFDDVTPAFDEAERPELMRVLKGYARELAPEYADMLVATTIGGELLKDYVSRAFPELGPEGRGRKYETLKRRRSRLLVRLRERLRAVVRENAEDENPYEERCAL